MDSFNCGALLIEKTPNLHLDNIKTVIFLPRVERTFMHRLAAGIVRPHQYARAE
jgi:hypothetical protein